MTETAELFCRESATFLRDVYVPRLERAVDVLPAGDLWWRPHAGVISIGTILKHLEGNVRQWILSGMGGAPDHRERAGEFTEAGDVDGAALLERLRTTVEETARFLGTLGDDELVRSYTIQGNDVTGTYAVAHVVEHFAWHTGQAVWIAKSRAGADHGVAFYDETRINAARNP